MFDDTSTLHLEKLVNYSDTYGLCISNHFCKTSEKEVLGFGIKVQQQMQQIPIVLKAIVIHALAQSTQDFHVYARCSTHMTQKILSLYWCAIQHHLVNVLIQICHMAYFQNLEKTDI